MTKPEYLTYLALGLIAALLVLAFIAAQPAKASAATMATSMQYPVKAICRKCQRPPAPS